MIAKLIYRLFKKRLDRFYKIEGAKKGRLSMLSDIHVQNLRYNNNAFHITVVNYNNKVWPVQSIEKSIHINRCGSSFELLEFIDDSCSKLKGILKKTKRVNKRIDELPKWKTRLLKEISKQQC